MLLQEEAITEVPQQLNPSWLGIQRFGHELNTLAGRLQPGAIL